MSWLELKLRCGAGAVAALEDLLLGNGAVSVTLTDAEDQPLFEPPPGETPLWEQLVLTALFAEEFVGEAASAALLAELQRQWAPAQLPLQQLGILADRDWVRVWLDDFKPMQFGERLWVCPSWWSAPTEGPEAWQPNPEQARYWSERNQGALTSMQQAGNVVLLLDPGLAFGTGTHPTTALCLRWLEGRPLAGLQLVDYGCGSGILGIAALLLGAESVLGVDNDPQALTATAENCRKNSLDPQRFPIRLAQDAAELQPAAAVRVDGVMANILAGTLITLAATLCGQVRPGGWLLLSGILREQAEAVITAYAPWCEAFDVEAEGDWVRISARRC